MGRRVLTCVVATVLLATGAACDVSGADRSDQGSCDEADSAVVDRVMAGARTNFRPVLPDGRPGILVDHLEVKESGVKRLPEKDREFGADRVLVLLVSTFVGGQDSAEGIGSFDGPVHFALDADGELLGPVGQFTTSLFDLEAPTDTGWLTWGDSVEDSTFGGSLYECVDPD